MSGKKLAVLFTTLLLVSLTAAAMLIPAAERARANGKADSAPVIEKANDHLVLDTPGLEKRVFIHYARPPCNNDNVCDADEKKSCGDCKAPTEEPDTTCYGFIGNGVKWRDLPQDYVIDPDNPDGMSKSFITNTISVSASEWDSHTGADLFDSYTIENNASWDGDPGDSPDGRNELLFEDYPNDNVIAVTVTWGYFNGPPWSRRIIEFDILFNTDFAWGDADNDNSLMDLQNIATHEIGHGIGLDDLYKGSCAEETMYGIGKEGETKKRDLAVGDIAGLQILYGS